MMRLGWGIEKLLGYRIFFIKVFWGVGFIDFLFYFDRDWKVMVV